MKHQPFDPRTVPGETGTDYPPPYDQAVAGRERVAVGDLFGLTQFGANATRLRPGAASAQRHWHACEDEFIVILEGEATLKTDEGETVMKAGMMAGFPAGDQNGHQLINTGKSDLYYIEIGYRSPVDRVEYPDADMLFVRDADGEHMLRKDGSPIEEKQ